MSINVEYIHDGGQESFECILVLSCDTITQTKQKIIKFIYKVLSLDFERVYIVVGIFTLEANIF